MGYWKVAKERIATDKGGNKNGKQIHEGNEKAGIKSEDQLLGILRNMSELDVLSHDDSNVGVVMIGNKDVVGNNPSELLELLEMPDKLQSKIDSKSATVLSYSVDSKTIKSIKEKLDKDFSKAESEMGAKIKK